MMRTTPELAHLLQASTGSLPAGPLPALHPSWVGRTSVGISHHTTGRTFGSPRYDLACNRPMHDRSSMESGFEPRTLRPQDLHLTIRPPRPGKWKHKIK
ncbi:hypothetical protein AVEN_134603-1 [Araneus ventricosus]|uniref:Uncharacterized protein n=1 Tax=Araneus ventricosus TaxID=182803 RepID=A0A4Y2KRD9_ARAVE|nr:hypothetical protein AVEN_134603-1 [Araneus ventricosus]